MWVELKENTFSFKGVRIGNVIITTEDAIRNMKINSKNIKVNGCD